MKEKIGKCKEIRNNPEFVTPPPAERLGIFSSPTVNAPNFFKSRGLCTGEHSFIFLKYVKNMKKYVGNLERYRMAPSSPLYIACGTLKNSELSHLDEIEK